MKKELLSPDNLTEALKLRRLELQKLLEIKLKAQKNMPQGHLRITQAGGRRSPQFYHITDPKDFNGVYIPQAQSSFIKKLAQKDYDRKIIKLLQRQLPLLDKFLTASDSKIEELYKKMSQTRQKLVVPAILTDEQYINEWQNTSWKGRPFTDNAVEYITARKEQVRSKSEVIIADTLNRMGIPYKYEYPLELKSGQFFYPDFLCLNVRTRREFIWEHFGMMDSPEYLENAVQKIKLCGENDFLPGKNLIITMETQHCPLQTRQLEKLIKAFLL